MFQSPLLGEVPSSTTRLAYGGPPLSAPVSIPSPRGSSVEIVYHDWMYGDVVKFQSPLLGEVPSSSAGGAAFAQSFTWFQSPLLGEVPSSCNAARRRRRRRAGVSIPSPRGSSVETLKEIRKSVLGFTSFNPLSSGKFRRDEAQIWLHAGRRDKLFQSPLLGEVPSR